MSSDASDPNSGSPGQPPRSSGYPSRPPSRGPGALGCLFAASVVFNVIALGIILIGCLLSSVVSTSTAEDSKGVLEKFHSGEKSASDKIAIVHLDGVIMEGLLEFVHKQIDKA